MKIKLLSIVLILCGLSFYSCSNDDEIFSCDPEANEWAKENLDDIRKMTRGEWLNLDETSQGAALAAFTSEQKKVFWLQKIDEVLSFDEWSNQERTHIQVLKDFLLDNSDFFERNITQDDEIFFYKWEESAKEELNWDDKLIFNMAHSGAKLMNVDGTIHKNNTNLKSVKSNTESGSGADLDCNCITVSACENSTNYQCLQSQKNLECKKKMGCGLFGAFPCTGRCWKTT